MDQKITKILRDDLEIVKKDITRLDLLENAFDNLRERHHQLENTVPKV